MSLGDLITKINDMTVSWPMLIVIMSVCGICTVAFRFVQLRYFFRAWKYVLFPEKQVVQSDMTPFQAFINSLGAGLGNGSVAGVATAVYSGGPGAAFWILVLGFVVMAVRFAEVFLSTYFGMRNTQKNSLGGPMLYLKDVAGGSFLVPVYVFFGFIFSLVVANGMQTNSIGISVAETWGIPPLVTATSLMFFMVYVVFGGAQRIIRVSDRLVPLKVITFFVSSSLVLIYHYQQIIPALRLIVTAAFTPLAIAGGAIGFAVQQALKYGVIRSIAATESGLGTTAIFFGSSGSKEPMKSGIMSMLSSFISTVVCFIVALCIVASGVWVSGKTSTALTVAAFNTVFGVYGGWIVSFLSITFGVGLLVSYAYVTREFWFYFTNRRYESIFALLYCAVAFGAVFIDPTVLWSLADLPNAGMLMINLFGIMWLVPLIRKEVTAFMRQSK